MVNDKVNLLVVTNLFPNPVDPIRGNFVEALLKSLKERCDITVVCPLPWFPRLSILKRFANWYKFALVPDKFEVSGITVISPKFIALPKLGFLHPIFIFIAILPWIVKVNKARKIDLINAHWVFPDGVAAVWISRILKIPVVLSAHGCDINLYTTFKWRGGQINSALSHAQSITTVSSAQKKILEKLGIKTSKIHMMRNGVDTNRFTLRDKIQCRQELNLGIGGKIILFIGQLEEVKGLNFLITAMKTLSEKWRGKLNLVVIGEGSLRRPFEELVSNLGLEKIVKFYGSKSHSEIPFWIGACDLLCLPSLREGCPCVVLEALACGRPIVASCVGEIPELVNSKSGILVELRSAAALSEALDEALQKEWSDTDIRGSIEHLTWKSVADKYYKVFAETLATEKDCK